MKTGIIPRHGRTEAEEIKFLNELNEQLYTTERKTHPSFLRGWDVSDTLPFCKFKQNNCFVKNIITFVLMFRAYKYRLFPNSSQKELIAKHIGSSRFVYNLALETKNAAYLGSKHNFSPFDLIKQLPDLKTECEWLKEVNSQSLQQSIQNMDIAFKKFFKGAGFPKFKKKSSGGSFAVPQNVIVNESLLIIPKFKEGIKVVLHRPIKGTIKSATVSVTPTGKYFASILVDTNTVIPTKVPIKWNTTIGVDLGIKSF